MSIYFGPREDSIFRPLRKWDWTPFKALIAPFAGPPHEIRTIEGLTLQAARNGASIVMERSDENFRIDTLNQTIARCMAENIKTRFYKMNWNDTRGAPRQRVEAADLAASPGRSIDLE